MAFFDRLREARINASLTQEQLATKLGIAKSTLSGYESGNREPSVATIAKALDILGIDANFLYQDEMTAAESSPMVLDFEEIRLLERYRELNFEQKDLVNMLLDTLLKNYGNSFILNVAHERTDIEVTDEMKKHDEDIMDDENF